MVAQQAKARHDILVSAVYWRMNEHVAVGVPQARALEARPSEVDSAPAPLEPMPVAKASPPAMPATSAVPAAATPPRAAAGRYQPIGDDEIAAFRQALADGVSRPAPLAAATPSAVMGFDGTPVHGPQSYTLLTGFEDTEMPESGRVPALSTTQYGDLV